MWIYINDIVLDINSSQVICWYTRLNRIDDNASETLNNDLTTIPTNGLRGGWLN